MINTSGQIPSSVDVLMQEYQTITHNIANANTAGYKRQVNSFSRELMRQMGDTGISGQEEPAQIVSESAVDFGQGMFENTGRNLDAAISGKGFFVIETPEGNLYTRNGVFQINSTGQLVDLSGRIVAGQSGPIVIPSSVSELDINIAEDGGISAGGTLLGKLRMVDFGEMESELESVGMNCFKTGKDVQAADAQGAVIRQGYRERSNVRIVEELVDLMSVSRMYEMNMSILRKQREQSQAMLSVANS